MRWFRNKETLVENNIWRQFNCYCSFNLYILSIRCLNIIFIGATEAKISSISCEIVLNIQGALSLFLQDKTILFSLFNNVHFLIYKTCLNIPLLCIKKPLISYSHFLFFQSYFLFSLYKLYENFGVIDTLAFLSPLNT